MLKNWHHPQGRRRAPVIGSLILACTASLAGCNGDYETASTKPSSEVDFRVAAHDGIKDSYLVGLGKSVKKSEVDALVKDLANEYGGKIQHVYTTAVKGYSVTMSEERARQLAADRRVAYVGQDVWGKIEAAQPSAPDHLDRIDQRSPTLDTKYNGNSDLAGHRPDIYVVDSGINATHNDFDGRVRFGTDTTPVFEGTERGEDCTASGHGTHVAGLAGSKIYGVARGANIINVKVAVCLGLASVSSTTAAIDWIAANAVPNRSVVNMSLGWDVASEKPTAVNMLETAITNSINSGIPFVVAAGNKSIDACNRTPARIPQAITVAAIDKNDARASFSNFGPCVDIFAPGKDIVSLTNKNNSGTATISGTSQASPQVAGAVARLRSLNPSATPAQLRALLATQATAGTVVNPGTSTTSHLLHTGGLYRNNVDVTLKDPGASFSSTAVSDQADSKAPVGLKVGVAIQHPTRGQLQIDLFAPDGTAYRLQTPSGDTGDNIVKEYTVNASAEAPNGTWQLRINDGTPGGAGILKSWHLQF